jgi:hypothetical protein
MQTFMWKLSDSQSRGKPSLRRVGRLFLAERAPTKRLAQLVLPIRPTSVVRYTIRIITVGIKQLYTPRLNDLGVWEFPFFLLKSGGFLVLHRSETMPMPTW